MTHVHDRARVVAALVELGAESGAWTSVDVARRWSGLGVGEFFQAARQLAEAGAIDLLEGYDVVATDGEMPFALIGLALTIADRCPEADRCPRSGVRVDGAELPPKASGEG